MLLPPLENSRMANFHLAQKRQNGSVFSFCHAIMFLFREGKKSFLQKISYLC
jgi:hypothetical protein